MATYEKEFLLKVLENLWKVRKFEQRAMEGGKTFSCFIRIILF